MLTKEWIGGFISGEGCFTFNTPNFAPLFCITLSKKDIVLLNNIKESVGLGRVNIGKKNFSNIYQIHNAKNCSKFINYIDGHIKGDKLIDFENWKLGVNLISSKIKLKDLSKKEKKFIYSLKPRQNKKRKFISSS